MKKVHSTRGKACSGSTHLIKNTDTNIKSTTRFQKQLAKLKKVVVLSDFVKSSLHSKKII